MLNLREFFCDNKKIRRIDPNSFKYNCRLVEVSISDNLLTKLYENTFWNQSDPKYLKLFNNQIRKIHPDKFKGLSRLQILWLEKNQISLLGISLFDDLINK